MKRYLISEASAITGLEAHVLRYWEEELGMKIPRNELGHRYYTDTEIEIFQKAKEMKNKGYQLKAIKTEIFGKADIIPIHMEHEQGELESEEQNTRDVRMEQFKAIIGRILTEALKENNVELHEKVVKEMDYLFRVNDEAAEERYKKLDETIRSCQRSGKEAAAGKDTRFKHRKKMKKLT